MKRFLSVFLLGLMASVMESIAVVQMYHQNVIGSRGDVILVQWTFNEDIVDTYPGDEGNSFLGAIEELVLYAGPSNPGTLRIGLRSTIPGNIDEGASAFPSPSPGLTVMGVPLDQNGSAHFLMWFAQPPVRTIADGAPLSAFLPTLPPQRTEPMFRGLGSDFVDRWSSPGLLPGPHPDIPLGAIPEPSVTLLLGAFLLATVCRRPRPTRFNG